MKTFPFILILITFLFNTNVKSQQVHLVSGSSEPCPNVEIYYQLLVEDYQNHSQMILPHSVGSWTVTNGTKTNGGNWGDDYVWIKWNDNGQNGSVSVSSVTYSCSSGICAAWPFQATFKIRSLYGKTPSNISGYSSVMYNSITPITYTITPIVYFDDEEISQYKWIIPNGWKHNGVTSTGSNEFSTTVPSITITPDNCSDGILKVRGINSDCTGSSATNWSSAKTITRTWPSYSILGSNVICENESISYTISNLPGNVTINWDKSSNLNMLSAQGSNPALFEKDGSSGQGFIKANLSINSCTVPPKEITKQIWVGDPNPNDFYIIGLDNYGSSVDLGDGTFEVCENQYYTFYLAPVYNLSESHHRYGITNVNFHFDFNYTYITGGYGWAYIVVNYIDDSSVGLVDVVGCSTINEFLDFGIFDGDCGYYYMTYSPNPADEFIEINFYDEGDLIDETNKIKIKKSKTTSSDKMGNFRIQILDNNGNIRKSVDSDNMKTIIETKDIEPGTYFLHLMYGKEIYKQQIIII